MQTATANWYYAIHDLDSGILSPKLLQAMALVMVMQTPIQMLVDPLYCSRLSSFRSDKRSTTLEPLKLGTSSS